MKTGGKLEAECALCSRNLKLSENGCRDMETSPSAAWEVMSRGGYKDHGNGKAVQSRVMAKQRAVSMN